MSNQNQIVMLNGYIAATVVRGVDANGYRQAVATIDGLVETDSGKFISLMEFASADQIRDLTLGVSIGMDVFKNSGFIHVPEIQDNILCESDFSKLTYLEGANRGVETYGGVEFEVITFDSTEIMKFDNDTGKAEDIKFYILHKYHVPQTGQKATGGDVFANSDAELVNALNEKVLGVIKGNIEYTGEDEMQAVASVLSLMKGDD